VGQQYIGLNRGGGNCRLHFLTACSMSRSKLRELLSELAAFSQKKTTYIRQTPPVSKSKSKWTSGWNLSM